MVTLDGHYPPDDNDRDAAKKLVKEHLDYCVRHGLSNFDNASYYAEDVRNQVEARLNELGWLEGDDLEADIRQVVSRALSKSGPTTQADQPPLDDLARNRALSLIDRVIASGEHLSEAGYLARIMYHLDVTPNNFLVGALWFEMNWFLKFERQALLGEKFTKSANTTAATQARVQIGPVAV